MEVGPRMYFLVSGLLYPAALGAALVWTVSALHARVFLESASPNGWSLCMAAWFIGYHCLQFSRLMVRHYDLGKGYTRRAFVSDLVDCLTLLLGFAGLRFLNEPIPSEQVWVVYLALLGVPLSAVIAHPLRMMKGPRGLLVLGMLLVCLLGIDYFKLGFLLPLFKPEVTHWVLLVAMFSMLWAFYHRVYRFEP
ncbi:MULTISPECIES: hypothetical protein [Pseudomonas]|nr:MULTISPECIES: hypothetical protein [Pseudomonas]WQN30389.1 hypothetical protein ULE26_22725 [Stutzerimonas stutzeri]AGL46453.1 hypothetical protein pOZ176_495 [Pseudomonas aeruginosa PA96]AJA17339.1 hypothetical protein RPPX_28880 [Pseudomonas putida S12]EIU1446477.1 hypothetical protein [Pseudomonas aeruginosa]EIU3128324.1 hypothetical protein [Pseudomonas aeruginosa]